MELECFILNLFKKMKKEEKEYKIETIEEFINLVTPDNFTNVMVDFTNLVYKLMILKKNHKKSTGEYPNSIMKSFIWIDDSFRGVKELKFEDGTILNFNSIAEDDE